MANTPGSMQKTPKTVEENDAYMLCMIAQCGALIFDTVFSGYNENI